MFSDMGVLGRKRGERAGVGGCWYRAKSDASESGNKDEGEVDTVEASDRHRSHPTHLRARDLETRNVALRTHNRIAFHLRLLDYRYRCGREAGHGWRGVSPI